MQQNNFAVIETAFLVFDSESGNSAKVQSPLFIQERGEYFEFLISTTPSKIKNNPLYIRLNPSAKIKMRMAVIKLTIPAIKYVFCIFASCWFRFSIITQGIRLFYRDNVFIFL